MIYNLEWMFTHSTRSVVHLVVVVWLNEYASLWIIPVWSIVNLLHTRHLLRICSTSECLPHAIVGTLACALNTNSFVRWWPLGRRMGCLVYGTSLFDNLPPYLQTPPGSMKIQSTASSSRRKPCMLHKVGFSFLPPKHFSLDQERHCKCLLVLWSSWTFLLQAVYMLLPRTFSVLNWCAHTKSVGQLLSWAQQPPSSAEVIYPWA